MQLCPLHVVSTCIQCHCHHWHPHEHLIEHLPVISFFCIFCLAGQPHVEQGGKDEGERGDENRRDQLGREQICDNH